MPFPTPTLFPPLFCQNHPAYRIAILYVYASKELVLERARQRAKETGRVVPEADIRDSLYRVPRTVAVLMPKADFVAHIEVYIEGGVPLDLDGVSREGTAVG